jgi:hypothetical protein
MSTLSDHVSHVVGGRTQKQVLRSMTSRVVAFMKNKQPRWDWSDVGFVSDAMYHKFYAADFHLGVFMVGVEQCFPALAVECSVSLKSFGV